MERKIGEIFEHNSEWYQCIEQPEKYDKTVCNLCDFHGIGNCELDRCSGTYRSDKKSVIFKKLEKVGEPYTTFVDKTVQNYLLETALTVPPKDVFTLINNEQRLIAIEIKQTKEDMEEKKLNLKPFDIQKAKAGKPVCTRDGRKARIICFDLKNDEYPIVAAVGNDCFENPFCYTENGKLTNGIESDKDLMMLPEKKEGWVNVYRDCDGANITKDDNIYSSKEAAMASAQVIDRDNYVATTIINWEE